MCYRIGEGEGGGGSSAATGARRRKWRGDGVLGARELDRTAFYRQQDGRGKHGRAESRFEPLRGRNQWITAAAEAPAGGTGNTRAAWCSGGAPAEELGRWRDGGVTRGRGRSWRWMAAARGDALRRWQGRQKGRAEEQRLREEEGERMELRTILQNQRNTGTSL
jgi:hypothetical protein